MSFDRFWSAYPKKEGKGAAIKAWGKATKDLSVDEIIDFTDKAVLAIDAQKRERWDASERKYIPMPATWLNQCRWLDEIKSHVEIRQQSVETCGCGAPAFNRKLCSRCYTKVATPELQSQMMENLHRMGFKRHGNEPWIETSMRCLTLNGLCAMIPRTITGNNDETKT
jgi:hypothetical protein